MSGKELYTLCKTAFELASKEQKKDFANKYLNDFVELVLKEKNTTDIEKARYNIDYLHTILNETIPARILEKGSIISDVLCACNDIEYDETERMLVCWVGLYGDADKYIKQSFNEYFEHLGIKGVVKH